MLALEVDKPAVKGFMGKLLRENMFDEYEVRSVDIAARTRIRIDGLTEPEQEYITWGELRSLVYEIIKAGSKPKQVKIVFSHRAADEMPNCAALFLNMVYENDGIVFTTAAAQKVFALDKTLDHLWDERVRGFFADKGLAVRDRV